MGLLDLITGINHKELLKVIDENREVMEALKKKEEKRHVQGIDENISQQVNIGLTVTLFTFQVPSKAILKVQKFANYTDTPAGIGALIWSIRINGIPTARYGALLDIIGQSFHPEEIVLNELRGGDLLTILATNGHDANVLMGIRVVLELGDN